jgi:hypothetical protein
LGSEAEFPLCLRGAETTTLKKRASGTALKTTPTFDRAQQKCCEWFKDDLKHFATDSLSELGDSVNSTKMRSMRMPAGPVAVSRLGSEETSREPQNIRAVTWLLEQPGGQVVVVTPRRDFSSKILTRLVASPGVVHHTWRGINVSAFDGQRVVYAWPDRKHLNDVWGAEADALVVIEWNENETAEWIADARPFQLLAEGEVQPPERAGSGVLEPLLNGIDSILEHVAHMAAGYSSGLKWNEEDMLKADMMNRPERWLPVTVEQVRAKCRQLGMKPKDIDTIADFVQRRKDGRRFNIRSSYRNFHFS